MLTISESRRVSSKVKKRSSHDSHLLLNYKKTGVKGYKKLETYV